MVFINYLQSYYGPEIISQIKCLKATQMTMRIWLCLADQMIDGEMKFDPDLLKVELYKYKG